MSEEQNLISELAEISAELAAWAEGKISGGSTAADIRALMREAARLTHRN